MTWPVLCRSTALPAFGELGEGAGIAVSRLTDGHRAAQARPRSAFAAQAAAGGRPPDKLGEVYIPL